MDFSKVKIIIWDLDDTFWKGTLSEGGVKAIPENIQLLKCASRHGVINSICSKNSREETELRLREMGVYDYFVFSSIDWTPKGVRIKRMLKTMGLRPQNALFLDDNPQNLNEALHYSQELMTGEPDVIKELCDYFSSIPETDSALKRLNQYRILEEKEEAKTSYASNEEFLYACNLHVVIHEDCSQQLERISELVLRSNQLNYTKLRSSRAEIENLILQKNIKSGWVSVYDKFGDYGMVGFYAIDKIKNECIHFLFSCRTIGQGVEQYVYAKLGFPKLKVVGEVVSMVNKDTIPLWINQEKLVETKEEKVNEGSKLKILFKGPCDLQGLTKYIKGNCEIDEEFTYVGKRGNVLSTQNHTVSICGLLKYREDEKYQLISENIFMDEGYYDSLLFSKEYDVVFLSSVLENNIGIYRRKGTELLLPFSNGIYPLTDEKCWGRYLYCDGKYDNGQNHFTEEYLQWFSMNYEFVGIETPAEYIRRLDFILAHLSSKTKLCILLGSELRDEKEKRPWMVNREVKHKKYNDSIKKWAELNKGRVWLLDVTDVIFSQDDYDGSINHFKVRIYFRLAQEVTKLLNEITGFSTLKRTNKINMLCDYLMRKVKKICRKALPHSFFCSLRKFYMRLKNT